MKYLILILLLILTGCLPVNKQGMMVAPSQDKICIDSWAYYSGYHTLVLVRDEKGKNVRCSMETVGK